MWTDYCERGVMAVEPGEYVHYKGGRYEVLGVARHSETDEKLVVYRALYGERGLWVRPEVMFASTVDSPDGPVPRFRALG